MVIKWSNYNTRSATQRDRFSTFVFDIVFFFVKSIVLVARPPRASSINCSDMIAMVIAPGTPQRNYT